MGVVMTVEELFKQDRITQDMLETVAEDSSYWESASSFVIQKWNTEVGILSGKQYDWLHRILEDLTEKRIEGYFK